MKFFHLADAEIQVFGEGDSLKETERTARMLTQHGVKLELRVTPVRPALCGPAPRQREASYQFGLQPLAKLTFALSGANN